MDIKEGVPLSHNAASQNGREFFHEPVTMESNSDAMLLDMAIKTEIKSETPFTKHLVKKIKCENFTCSDWEIDGTTEIEQQTLDFGSQNEGNIVPENCEVKEEPWWLETQTTSVCDEIKDFPPVNSSRLSMEIDSGTNSGMSPLLPVEVSGRNANFINGKDRYECEHRESDVTEMPTAEENVLSGQSVTRSDGMEMNTRPLYLKQNRWILKGERPHQCKTCEKSYRQLSHLKAHNLVHEGKRPYKCKVCDKSFFRLHHLKTHNLMHEGKKPHQCKNCGKCFTLIGNLKAHNLIHEDKRLHRCNTCDKSFTYMTQLKAHTLIHEGKKPHLCKTCNKSFTQSAHLKAHMLIHEGKKPHQCKTCDKSFTQLASLKKHILIHDGTNLPVQNV